LRRIFHWHETRTDDFRSPIIRGMGARQNTVEHRRSRILDDAEIRKLWAATADGSPFSALVRFLLLTSARRNEAAAMKFDEVVDGIWTLPASRSKTKVEVIRPLSKAAQAILAESGRESSTTLDRIMTTLQAAAVSDEGRELLALGRLTGDLEATGFDLLAPMAKGAPKRKRPAPRPKPKPKPDRRRIEQARAKVREAERHLRAAERGAEKARSELERAEKELRDVERN